MASRLRIAMFVGLVGLTFYLPKMVSDGRFSGALRSLLRTQSNGESSPLSVESRLASYEGNDYANAPLGGAANSPIRIEAPAIGRRLLTLDQFLRFDLTPEWVTSQFDRVSLLAELEGEGMRVALVTGTRAEDLTGSLTYYFDADRQVRRIVIQGATGNPAELAAFVKEKYKLEEVARGAYVRQFHRVVLSGLLVEPSPIIENNKPRDGYRVLLEINRPDNYTQVSPEFRQRLLGIAAS